MKFNPITGPVRSNRRRQTGSAPVAAETYEQRALMTTPAILAPVANSVVTTARPEITWTPVDNAVSYDIWITDADSRSIILVQGNILDNRYTPTVDLNQGNVRVWVRAQLSGGPAPDWSSPVTFRVQAVPTVTGPVNPLLPRSPQKIDSHTPTITWHAAPGSSSFEIWLADRSTKEYTTYVVPNLTPVLDSEGNPTLDDSGNIIRTEVRSFTLPESLPMGRYEVWIRTTDDAGRVTRWSNSLKFEVAPKVDILRPSTATLFPQPVLEWSPVESATHYELQVDGEGRQGLYRERLLTTTSWQIPRPIGNGTYTFWVRAIHKSTGNPDVTGIWSDAATFSKATIPEITAPVGTDGVTPGVTTVTETRPTFEWTEFDGAARYDFWIDRGFGPAGYLRTTSSTNSYTLTEDLAAGRYTAWVRAVSTRGVPTAWSPAFEFQATGGAPIILSPADNSPLGTQPEFTWTPVGNAASYELWISYVGVDFDFYVKSDIPTESHMVETELPAGTYRAWVRAVLADGTALNWSAGINFTVTVGASEQSSESALASVLTTGILVDRQQTTAESHDTAKVETATVSVAGHQADSVNSDQMFEHVAQSEARSAAEDSTLTPMSAALNAAALNAAASDLQSDALLSAKAINLLAESCVHTEWWSTT